MYTIKLQTSKMWCRFLKRSHVVIILSIYVFIFGTILILDHFGHNNLREIKQDVSQMSKCRENCLKDHFPVKWIMSPGFCEQNDPLTLLIVIHSNPNYNQKRNLIRKTIGNEELMRKGNYRLVFVVGRTNSTENELIINKESEQYHDILMFDYTDGYDKIALKSLYWLWWVSQTCQSVPLILHLDDDVTIDLTSILAHFQEINTALFPSGIACTLTAWKKSFPKRNPKNKWFVSKESYPHKFWPPFCAGGAYFVRTTDTEKIVKCLLEKMFLPTDDVLISGICRQETQIPLYETQPIKSLDQNVKQSHDLIKKRKALAVLWKDEKTHLNTWELILNRSPTPVKVVRIKDPDKLD